MLSTNRERTPSGSTSADSGPSSWVRLAGDRTVDAPMSAAISDPPVGLMVTVAAAGAMAASP